MTKEKTDFIQKNEKNAILAALLTPFIINAVSASHLVKLFVSFGIMKCTFRPPLVEMLFIVIFWCLCEYVACSNY